MIEIETSTSKLKLIELINDLKKINVIYDCGSRDGLDGIELLQKSNAKELHVFECNPPSVVICKKNLVDILGREVENTTWFLNDLAISDKIGTIDFRPIDTENTITPHKDGNPGASSLFEASERYTKEKYIQSTINVNTITLDEYSKVRQKPDLLWMDLQGAELLALKGCLNVLDNVKIVHVEVSFREMYKGQCSFWDIDDFLVKNNFRLFDLDIGRWPKLPYFYKLFRTGPWVGNALYLNNTYG